MNVRLDAAKWHLFLPVVALALAGCSALAGSANLPLIAITVLLSMLAAACTTTVSTDLVDDDLAVIETPIEDPDEVLATVDDIVDDAVSEGGVALVIEDSSQEVVVSAAAAGEERIESALMKIPAGAFVVDEQTGPAVATIVPLAESTTTTTDGSLRAIGLLVDYRIRYAASGQDVLLDKPVHVEVPYDNDLLKTGTGVTAPVAAGWHDDMFEPLDTSTTAQKRRKLRPLQAQTQACTGYAWVLGECACVQWAGLFEPEGDPDPADPPPVGGDFGVGDITALRALVGAPDTLSDGYIHNVVPVGDFNGDGVGDFAVHLDDDSAENEENVAVIFGGDSRPSTLFMADGSLGDHGVFVNIEDDSWPYHLSAADINGDNKSDLVIHEPVKHRISVVFGDSAVGSVDTDSLGTRGFQINNVSAPAEITQVSHYETYDIEPITGDINGDGMADLVLTDGDESVFVVFGSGSAVDIELPNIAGRGFEISDIDAAVVSGYALSASQIYGQPIEYSASAYGSFPAATGDINGDGFDDIVSTKSDGAEVLIIFGADSDATVYASGPMRSDARLKTLTGGAVSEITTLNHPLIADINGDDKDDIVLRRAVHATQDSDRLYVVFGDDSTAEVDLADLGDSGFLIEGTDYVNGGLFSFVATDVGYYGGTDYYFVESDIEVGDFNGDGKSDLAIATRPYAGLVPGGDAVGDIFLVFGKTSSAPVDLNTLGNDGNVIEGFFTYAGYQGGSVLYREEETGGPSPVTNDLIYYGLGNTISVGDVDGDGIDDIGLLGGSVAHDRYDWNQHKAIVIFGQSNLESATIDIDTLEQNPENGFALDISDVSRWNYDLDLIDLNGDGRSEIVTQHKHEGAGAQADALRVFGDPD